MNSPTDQELMDKASEGGLTLSELSVLSKVLSSRLRAALARVAELEGVIVKEASEFHSKKLDAALALLDEAEKYLGELISVTKGYCDFCYKHDGTHDEFCEYKTWLTAYDKMKENS